MSNAQLLTHPVALSIAGSDSGAGAGIQADLKTFAAFGVYGTTVLTMVTAQSTSAVDHVEILPAGLVTRQLETVFADFQVSAMKTGALGSSENIKSVSGFLKGRPPVDLVVDPVMISKHGHALLPEEPVTDLVNELLPLAACVTPNLMEAQALAGCGPITDRDGMLAAASRIMDYGCRAVVVKGGHREGDPVDLLWDGANAHWFAAERIDTPHTHGTGCTFSSAITAGLVRGNDLKTAVQAAKDFISGAITHHQLFGKGLNPVNHFWRSQPEFGNVDC